MEKRKLFNGISSIQKSGKFSNSWSSERLKVANLKKCIVGLKGAKMDGILVKLHQTVYSYDRPF